VQNPEAPPVKRLRDLSPQQWKSGIAAWLGWLFDGLDMHLYTLVAAPFVAVLLGLASSDTANPLVKEKSSWIQAAFLVGWALGGGFFGRLGDLLGRSRALSLTILTYACFTGLSFFAQTWQQMMIFRFVAALGIGGEWAVGSALLAETWPKHWRPWIAAVLQTGVNLGVLLACGTALVMRKLPDQYTFSLFGSAYTLTGVAERSVFLVGVLPALLVFWIRRQVPEPEEWKNAKQHVREQPPGVRELFRGSILRTTLLTIIVCATSLSGWWAFMFWHPQHLMNLPELQTWSMPAKKALVANTFFWVITISILGNFFAGSLAKLLGYRRALALMYLGFVVTFLLTFLPEWEYPYLTRFWLPAIGFWSGLFGLFTMFLPPLFPTLLRTTGAGFCYNIGRIVSALATVFSGVITAGGNFRLTLLLIGLLFVPPMVVVLFMREPPDETLGAGG
jgi:MFS family permease